LLFHFLASFNRFLGWLFDKWLALGRCSFGGGGLFGLAHFVYLTVKQFWQVRRHAPCTPLNYTFALALQHQCTKKIFGYNFVQRRFLACKLLRAL
jgi:hypothetical protein